MCLSGRRTGIAENRKPVSYAAVRGIMSSAISAPRIAMVTTPKIIAETSGFAAHSSKILLRQLRDDLFHCLPEGNFEGVPVWIGKKSKIPYGVTFIHRPIP